MWLKINQFRTAIDTDDTQLRNLAAKALKLPANRILTLGINRKSLDARHKNLEYVYTLICEVDLTDYEAESLLKTNPNLTVYQPEPTAKEENRHQNYLVGKVRPVIAGAGPAGLFAGLRLAAAGMKPIIIDRGDGLEARIIKVNQFWETGKLDPDSNIQYGIGGAGTFSDGKLTTRIKDPGIQNILQTMVKFGAPPEILYWQYPHIGTDLLREVVTGIEKSIIESGGEFRYRNRLTGIKFTDNKVNAIEVNDRDYIETEIILLAAGNSARDLYRKLVETGIGLNSKPFAVGLRIEHPQDLIDRAQYGRWAGRHGLGPAEYHLTYKHQATGRGVYTFCMCPGGFVIGAASHPEMVVTNGMSYYRRDSGVANAAVIVTVNEKDYGNNSALAGLEYQEKLEAKAFQMGKGGFRAPAQRVDDFLKNRISTEFKELSPSYRPGVTKANLRELFPEEIGTAIADGIKYFGRQLKGFDWPEAVLTGVETRTSAPVRILRDERRQAIGFEGIYPVGEGAGYAGGIISSALDGWKTAEAIIKG